MHNIDLILTLAAGLIAALVRGYFTHRLGLSPIVGYLLAGILVGPNTPGFVANHALAEQLAEVGVILLMFGVGMHFHLKDLLAVRGISVAGAVVQSATATALGGLAFHAMGLSWTAGIVMGLALSVASTVVLIRVLSDNGQLQGATGRIAVGWLVSAGANEVITGEGEVALAIAGSILHKLGATPEQLDDARERIRMTLLDRTQAKEVLS
jgi:CPA2 family monovalent cation:H+ antiporter-2